jgi:hypothetical protein
LKKGYQPRTNLVKVENGYLLAVRRSVLNTHRWNSYFCQLLTASYTWEYIRLKDVHTAEAPSL